MLNTDVSSLKQKKSSFLTKPVYFLIQFLIYEISLLLGLSIASTQDKATYPITSPNSLFLIPYSFFMLLPIHGVNGIITIPGKRRFGFSYKIRITVFLMNLLISMYAVSLILGTVSPGAEGVMYGVFDRSSLLHRGDHNNKIWINFVSSDDITL